LFEPSGARLEAGLARLQATLADIWTKTRSPVVTRPRFMQQLLARVEDIRAVHPRRLTSGGAIQGVQIPSFGELVARCVALDAELSCPYSVLIHGDFNVDNVIYDELEDRVRFIDLHRSRNMDYCQDVSVFLVSNFRLQSFDPMFRRHVDWVVMRFFEWAAAFAAEAGDESFQLRLALGMARSYVTSTRFVLDEALVGEMFAKSRYILQAVVNALADNPARFRFPKEVLLG
jgi:hypothetical protein